MLLTMRYAVFTQRCKPRVYSPANKEKKQMLDNITSTQNLFQCKDRIRWIYPFTSPDDLPKRTFMSSRYEPRELLIKPKRMFSPFL